MFDLTSHPRLLRLSALGRRIKELLRRGNARARAAAKSRAAFYSTAWREAADELGATVRALGGSILEIDFGGESTRVRNHETPLDDPVTLAVAGDKPLVYRLLAAHGLPTASHVEFDLNDLSAAIEFLERSPRPCVVKPACDTGGGQGVSTGVTSRRALGRAIVTARAYGPRLLIETEIAGDVYRLLYLDGELLDACLRRPPHVVGDGASTIRRLVHDANAARFALGESHAQATLDIDLEMKHTLRRQGYTLRSAPRMGQSIALKMVNNDNLGAENLPAAELLCDSIVEVGAAATRAVGAKLAGVDVITRDPNVPLAESGGVILEVNTTPGYFYHYHQQGRRFPVAIHVLRRLLGIPQSESPLPAAPRPAALPSLVG